MEETFHYYDVSPEISEEIAVWPGDIKFQRNLSLDFKTGGNLLLSAIHTTVHLGAHADAPNHYHPQGQGIGARKLESYFGLCQVITVSLPPHSRIQPAHLGNVKFLAKRVLFKTRSFPNPNRWNSDFVALSPEL